MAAIGGTVPRRRTVTRISAVCVHTRGQGSAPALLTTQVSGLLAEVRLGPQQRRGSVPVFIDGGHQ